MKTVKNIGKLIDRTPLARACRQAGRFLGGSVLLALLFFATTGFAQPKRVAVIADGRTVFLTTEATAPEAILKEAHIAFSAADTVRITSPKIAYRTVITVYRPVPVRLIVGHHKQNLTTSLPTIGELLAAQKIDLVANRAVLPLETRLKPNMNVVVVPRSIEEQQKLRSENDAAAKFKADQARAAAAAAERERLLASGQYVETPEGIKRFVAYYIMEATAYLPTDGSGEGITATGIPARYGIVAVDPRVIPLGTRLYVPGYGVALAADTGGAIIGNIIDLCYESYDAAIQFGRRNVEVYILAD